MKQNTPEVGIELLRVCLLGGFQVHVGQRTPSDSAWRLRKARSLVKLLALAPEHRLHREQLLDLLWPDLEPAAAANNLHQALYAARRAFETAGAGAECLRWQNGLLSLPTHAVWVDVEAFAAAAAAARRARSPESYAAALRLYTGELLPEDRFEDWAADRREALAVLYRALLSELARLLEERGNLEAAIEAVRQLVASDMTNEDAHVQLIRLLASAGQRHVALRQYQQLCESLRRELGVEPAPGSRELYQDILSGPFQAGQPDSARWPVAAAGLRPVGAGTPAAAALVGRQTELATLAGPLESLFQGRGGLVLVGGEAGVGKSRLAHEIADRVRGRGGRVLWGAAYEQEGELPYGPFVEAFGPLAGARAGADLAAVVPEAPAALGFRTPPGGPGATDRQRLFKAVFTFVEHLAAATPLLLVLDDLHAADRASLELLHYLARTTRQLPLLILGTFRRDEAGPATPLGQLMAALHRQHSSSRLDLARLGRPASDALVAELLDGSTVEEAVGMAVYELAEGNPFYTEEMVRSLRQGGQLRRLDGAWRLAGGVVSVPIGLRDLVVARLSRLDPAARQVLQVAAVVGREVSYGLLQALGESSDAELLEAVDAALAHGWFEETADGYRFGHPLQRLALYDRLTHARRAHLHGQIATTLEMLAAAGGDSQAQALAHHWLRSEQPGRSVRYLLQGADRAAIVHANEDAIEHYRRALALIEAGRAPEYGPQHVVQSWEKLGDLCALTGEGGGALDAYTAALAALERALEPADTALTRARLQRKIAYAHLVRHEPAPAEARAARELAPLTTR